MKLLFQIEGVVLIYSGFIQKVFFNEFFYDRSCGWVEEVGFCFISRIKPLPVLCWVKDFMINQLCKKM